MPINWTVTHTEPFLSGTHVGVNCELDDSNISEIFIFSINYTLDWNSVKIGFLRIVINCDGCVEIFMLPEQLLLLLEYRVEV